MFVVGEAVIDDPVGRASFCCDLEKCKGACCFIAGGKGAPLENDEVREIQNAFPIAKHYLSERSIRTLETQGLVDGTHGAYATPCIDDRECAFAYFDDGVARCSFERAYEEGKTAWRKPLSCHLFPIRINRFVRDYVRYEEIEECLPGRERGDGERIRLREFLRPSLVRKYGERWYRSFLEHCDSMETR